MAILECVPNFSEGRDPEIIEAIAGSIRATPGVTLLHVDTSPGANRTVMTFAGAPEAVEGAAFAAIATASTLIDMRRQEGVHPRIGAADVCPLIPLRGMSTDEAVGHSRQLGARVGAALNIPVFLYEFSASAPHRRALPDIRRGQYDGFAEKMRDPGWRPDFGPDIFNPSTGASVIGARDILVAFNISLRGGDESTAAQIAAALRERGKYGDAGAVSRLKGVRAIGWHQPDYNQSQVSMNLLDYRTTSPLQAFEACRVLATRAGAAVTGCELIGCIPEACLLEAGVFARVRRGLPADLSTVLLVREGIDYLGLDKVRPFNPEEQVLEWALRRAGLIS